MFTGGVGGSVTREDFEKMKPEMVAPLVVFLATDEAYYINGLTFNVGGGDVGIFREREIRSTIHKDGIWTIDELTTMIPKILPSGLTSQTQTQPTQA